MSIVALWLVLNTMVASQNTNPAWIAPTRGAAPAAAAPAASWVWVAAPGEPAPTTAGAPVGAVWIARTFELPADADGAAATLVLAADNHAVAWLNGVEVLRSDAWSRPSHADVQLAPGGNTLAIRAENGPGTGVNPAGVIALLTAPRADGATFTLATDAGWRGATAAWAGWPAAEAPESATPVVVLGPADVAPWNLAALHTPKPPPCPILRREFTLAAAPTKATVRVIGLGHYELRLNGRVVGDTLVNQVWTQYDKTLLWQEFDITPLLRAGPNAWGVLLGNSFWRVEPANDAGRFVKTDAMPDFSRGEPHLLWLDARVQTADGGEQRIPSDASWKWTAGPLTFSHIYAGEDYDATRVEPGWDAPGFDDSAWRPVRLAAEPPAKLAPLRAPGIQAFEVFEPAEIRAPADGVFTYVFPQNSSALLRFTVEGPRGAPVRFKPCEYMDPSGRVKFSYTWGTGKDIWHDYTLAGGGPESHQVLFCYVGCQFVEVTGAVPAGRPNPQGLPVIRTLELVHTRTANRGVGEFSCSSELQNRAHALIDWSIRSNMSHVATDCPHREKNGWQEETWHMARAIGYRYDVRDWYRKIAGDLRDTQLPDGHIPTNCPNYLVGIPPHGFWNEAPEWGVAGVLTPWHIYEWYGDRDALAESFDSMTRYVDYLSSLAEDGVIGSNLGDWYDFGHGKGDGPSRWTPSEVSATAVWALGAATVARTAEILGREAEAKRYGALFEQIRADFQRKFWDAKTSTVSNHGSCQSANAVALCADLVPEDARRAALDAIVRDLEQREWQQTTGEVLHVFLIRALAEAGRGDVLHKVYAREQRGSYGYMVRSGLTTLPESWDAKPGTGNSMNHFMLGHLMEWHFAFVAGIRQKPGGVGWRDVLIAPQPGPLREAGATFESPAGRIASRWKREGDAFTLRVEIPAGVRARAVLPDGGEHDLPPGEQTLRCRLR